MRTKSIIIALFLALTLCSCATRLSPLDNALLRLYANYRVALFLQSEALLKSKSANARCAFGECHHHQEPTPLALEKKADFYRTMLQHEGLL